LQNRKGLIHTVQPEWLDFYRSAGNTVKESWPFLECGAVPPLYFPLPKQKTKAAE
jgi:hypothetical protein